MRKYETARIDELEEIPVAGVNWRPVRRRFGITAFGVNVYTGDAGEHVVEEHTESRLQHEELYVVLRGHARFTIGNADSDGDGEEVDAPAGTLVFVGDPDVKRAAVAVEGGTAVMGIGAKPGEPYAVSAWEYWFAAQPAYEAKEFGRAYEIAAEGLEVAPDSGALHYQLACFAALGGDEQRARGHLVRAFELDERTRDWAARDEDLDSLRGKSPL